MQTVLLGLHGIVFILFGFRGIYPVMPFYNTLLIFLIFLSFSGSPVETNGARAVTVSGGAGDVSPFARSSAFRAFRASRFSFCLIACFEGCAEVKIRYLANMYAIQTSSSMF